MILKTVGSCLIACIGAACLAGMVAANEPGDWRVDYRRPAASPFADKTDQTVDAWAKDSRRPGMVPMRDTDKGMVEWWRTDDRRPAPWPHAGMKMVKAEPMDSDGDGVMDPDDACPNTPKGAKVDSRGCPMDSDGDGVYDGIDRCPDTPKGAKVDARGCPLDGDGDGVYDGIDRCPDTPKGVAVDENGCTKVTSEKEAELLNTGSLRLENVFFDTNKATLRPESHAVLDEAGEILAKWPQLKIEVGGHTDSQGDDNYNMDLSRRRAQAVLDYLLQHYPAINGDQYTVKGYGETVPIADNGNAAGRAQNRRVELRVLNQGVLKK